MNEHTPLLQAHLNEPGRVPCSRYGTDSRSCLPVAYAVALILEAETGEPLSAESLDHAMALVVNDFVDPEALLQRYGPEYGLTWSEDEGLQDTYGTVTDAIEEATR